MAWRLAKSLLTLQEQINAAFPGRDRGSDGTIGDSKHATRKSEHNPDANGVVRALDITHDPAHGLDARKLAELLIASRDPRILYVISNGEINSSVKYPWTWRPYTGPNAHRQHVHISVVEDPAFYDDAKPWIGLVAAQPSPPMSQTSPELRLRMARAILDYEARRDSQGHLAVYDLPAGDGGGAYEVAGVNERYHKAEADHLVALIRAGSFDEAEKYATEFMLRFTDVVVGWGVLDAGVEFYLRDCVFNRGPTGAAAILQIALGGAVAVDGIVGEKETKPALVKASPAELLSALHPAREKYERSTYPWKTESRDESSPFWKGLVARWDKVLEQARKFSLEVAQPTPQPIPIPAPEPIPKPEPIPQPLPLPEPVSPQPVSISDIEQISREIVRDLLLIRQIVGATLAALTGHSSASPSVSAKFVPTKEAPMSMSATSPAPVAGDVVPVVVKSAWYSKINWTQAVALAASVLTMATGGKFNISPETQVAILTGITTLQSVATVLFKTFGTSTVTPGSMTK